MIKENIYKVLQLLLSNNFFFKIKLHSIKNKKKLTIINLHRINPDKKIHNSITPSIFNELIQYLKKEFNIICFNDLKNYNIDDNKPPLIISFDDAYEDFFDYAAEIIINNNIKVNQNIIPYGLLTEKPPINVQFQDLYNSGILNESSQIKLCKFLNIKNLSLYSLTKSIKNLSIVNQKKLLITFSSEIESLNNKQKTKIMNLKQINDTKAICELGLHSYEHATMTNESIDYFKNDLKKSIDFFEKNFSHTPVIYAFPNGKYNNQHISHLKYKKFKYILLVGNNTNKFNSTGIFYRNQVLGGSLKKNKFTSLGGLKF